MRAYTHANHPNPAVMNRRYWGTIHSSVSPFAADEATHLILPHPYLLYGLIEYLRFPLVDGVDRAVLVQALKCHDMGPLRHVSADGSVVDDCGFLVIVRLLYAC